MSAPPGWATLHEIDRAAGAAKGAAFRAFKRSLAQWREGPDYVVLDATRHRAQIDALRAQGRVYASSVNIVMVAPALAASLRAALE